MSGLRSRRRGADTERAVVTWLRNNGHPDARRRLAGNGQAGDIDGVPGLVLEVKAQSRSTSWGAWCRQAAAEAGGTPWAVVHRTPGARDVAAWPVIASHTALPAFVLTVTQPLRPTQALDQARKAHDWAPCKVEGLPLLAAGQMAWLFDHEREWVS